MIRIIKHSYRRQEEPAPTSSFLIVKEKDSNFVQLKKLIDVDIELFKKKQPVKNWSGLVKKK